MRGTVFKYDTTNTGTATRGNKNAPPKTTGIGLVLSMRCKE